MIVAGRPFPANAAGIIAFNYAEDPCPEIRFEGDQLHRRASAATGYCAHERGHCAGGALLPGPSARVEKRVETI